MANNGAPPGDYNADYGTTAGGPRGWFGGTNAPGAGDYRGAAEQTARSSATSGNANSSNIYGADVTNQIGADGRPIVTQSMGGPMGAGAYGIMGQFGSTYANPFNFSGPGMVSGDQARDQAISGAYNQATSRLDPQWDQRQSQMQTQLLNQGLDPGSEASQNAFSQFGRDRNDAYGSAMNSAIGQGTAAGSAIFNQGLQSHNTAYDEQMGQYGMPMAMAQALGGFTQQPGYNGTAGTNYLGALGLKDASRFRNWDANNNAEGDFWGGLTSGITDIAGLFGLGKKAPGGGGTGSK